MYIHAYITNFGPIWDVYTQVMYSDNLCQMLPGDEFPVEIWQSTGTGFNWVQAHSQNFVLVFGNGMTMRISFNSLMERQGSYHNTQPMQQYSY